MPGYVVVDNEFNRANYPDLIGKEFANPPAFARVRAKDAPYSYFKAGGNEYRVGQDEQGRGLYFVDYHEPDDPLGNKWYALSVGLDTLAQAYGRIKEHSGDQHPEGVADLFTPDVPVWRCPQCHQNWPRTASKCPSCGHNQTWDAPPASRRVVDRFQRPEGEEGEESAVDAVRGCAMKREVKSKTVTGYLGVVEADSSGPFPSNWLLGGVKVQTLGPYASATEAQGVADTSKRINEDAGRRVAKSYVRSGQYTPGAIIRLGSVGRRSQGVRKPRLSR